MKTFLPIAAVSLLALACSTQVVAPPLQHLQRPGDLAFGCVGNVNVPDSGPTLVSLPLTSCTPSGLLPDAGPDDAGATMGATGATPLGFITETARGDVSVATLINTGSFVDSDPFAPGLSGVPVGHLPVGIATTPDGCYAVTANAGSCDLGLVNVANAAGAKSNAITRLTVTNSAGALLSRPMGILALPSLPRPVGVPPACHPNGFVYVSFPSCHLVARVGLADGKVIDGVQFPPGQAPALVDGTVTCPATCDAPGPDAGTGAPVDVQPSSMALAPDAAQLFVGSVDSPDLQTITLDATGRPTAVETTTLEGALGLGHMAVTKTIGMGNDNLSGDFRFLYAIARDEAIHVVDVTPGRAPRECDTQIDRRYLHTFINVTQMACFPVGDPTNPPRRVDAQGPGVRLPHGILPLDLTFVYSFTTLDSVPGTNGQPQPSLLNGVFAIVSALGPSQTLPRGMLFYINVDDDNYVDTQQGFSVAGPLVELALPHTVRDGNVTRSQGLGDCAEITDLAIRGPVRIDGSPLFSAGFITNAIGKPGDLFAPSLHRILCNGGTPMWELSIAAPPDVRGALFPDLDRINLNERFVVQWEGTLNPDRNASQRTGGTLHALDSNTLQLGDPGGLNCKVGVEPRDFVELLGCGGDGDCDLGESCFSHPEAPPGLPGMCFPTNKVAELAGRCRDVLVSLRRYTITDVASDWVAMVPRVRVMNSTPLDGCADATECTTIQEREVSAREDAAHIPRGTLSRHTMNCAVDTATGGPQRCLMTCKPEAKCTAQNDPDCCDAGSVCQAGRCVLGPIPPAECLGPLQRYEFHGGDVFTVLSSDVGYRGREKRDSTTGKCVQDTSLDPLVVGRFHRVEPSCTDVTVTGTAPNPCLLGNATEPYKDPNGVYVTRPAYAVRFRTPGVVFDVTDIGIALPEAPTRFYGPYPSGYQFQFQLGGGYNPMVQNRLGLNLPGRLVHGLDESVWVVDSGDSALLGGPQGQVVLVPLSGDESAIRLSKHK